MKKCPTCDKTFDDGMRFCQTDGTPLITATEIASDPFKTIVSNQNEISAPAPDPFKTMVGVPPPKKDEDDILQLPENDSLKTQVVSQTEMSEEMKDTPPPFGDVSSWDYPTKEKLDNFGSAPLEIPKIDDASSSPPDLGTFSAEELRMRETSASDSTLVVSEDSENVSPQFDSSPFSQDSPRQSNFEDYQSSAIPSPFDNSMPPGYQTPSSPPFKEPEQPFGAANDPFNQSPYGQQQTPFGQQSAPYNAPIQQSEWTPPPAPVSNWQDQGLNANTPFQPPVTAQGQNQTLPIVSLVCGIVSLFCCWIGFLLGPAALVIGYLGKNNINKSPSEYGGSGLALAGMITGGIGTLISVAYFLLIILGAIANPS